MGNVSIRVRRWASANHGSAEGHATASIPFAFAFAQQVGGRPSFGTEVVDLGSRAAGGTIVAVSTLPRGNVISQAGTTRDPVSEPATMRCVLEAHP